MSAKIKATFSGISKKSTTLKPFRQLTSAN